MYESFERLNPEKRDAILCAAMDEFAARGYTLASTNEIVKGAGISKGSLFHYFGDKKGLFVYLCDFVSSVLDKEYFSLFRDRSGDLIVRLRNSVGLKMKVLSRYPRLFAFCTALNNDTDPEVQFEIAFFRRSVSDAQFQALLEGLDDSLIREDIPPVEANRMLWWILDGYSNELSEQVTGQPAELMDMEYEINRFDRFLALLRRIFYR